MAPRPTTRPADPVHAGRRGPGDALDADVTARGAHRCGRQHRKQCNTPRPSTKRSPGEACKRSEPPFYGSHRTRPAPRRAKRRLRRAPDADSSKRGERSEPRCGREAWRAKRAALRGGKRRGLRRVARRASGASKPRSRGSAGGRRPSRPARCNGEHHSRDGGGLRGVDPPGNRATAPQLSLRRRGHCVASNPLADGGTAWRGAAAHVTIQARVKANKS